MHLIKLGNSLAEELDATKKQYEKRLDELEETVIRAILAPEEPLSESGLRSPLRRIS